MIGDRYGSSILRLFVSDPKISSPEEIEIIRSPLSPDIKPGTLLGLNYDSRIIVKRPNIDSLVLRMPVDRLKGLVETL